MVIVGAGNILEMLHIWQDFALHTSLSYSSFQRLMFWDSTVGRVFFQTMLFSILFAIRY